MSRRRIAQQYDDDYDDDDYSYGSYGGDYGMSASPNTSQYMSHASRGGNSLFDFVDEASHKKDDSTERTSPTPSTNAPLSSLLSEWSISEDPPPPSSSSSCSPPSPSSSSSSSEPSLVSSLLKDWSIQDNPPSEPESPSPALLPPTDPVSSLLEGWGIEENPTPTPTKDPPTTPLDPPPSDDPVSSLLGGWGIEAPSPQETTPSVSTPSLLLKGWGIEEEPVPPSTSITTPQPDPPSPSSQPQNPTPTEASSSIAPQKTGISSLLDGWGIEGTPEVQKDLAPQDPPPPPTPSTEEPATSLLKDWEIPKEAATALTPKPKHPPPSTSLTSQPFPSSMAHILCFPPPPFDPHSLASYQKPKKRTKCATDRGGDFTIRDLLAASSIRDIARKLYVMESHQMGMKPFMFDNPSPDDVVLISRGLMKGGGATEKRKPIVKQPDGPKKKAPSPSPSPSSTSPLDEPAGSKASDKSPRASSSPSPSPSSSFALSSSSSQPGIQKIKKQRGEAKTKDLQARFEREKKDSKEKEHLNLVVIGHVDAGKSTIMGHLLYLIGDVSNKELHRFKVDSENMGKGSFHFAWVLDQNTEERERGVTMDISVNYFDTQHKKVTLLDAPGHRDFVPRMIAGAAQADVAILVINASLGEFEKGFESDGQTKEHAVLARSLGITRLIIAINKLDLEGWSEERYREIEGKLSKYLIKEGFAQKNLAFLPCSGLTGENIKSFSANGGEWYKGPTLLQAIDEVPAIPRRVEKPFRMSISDVYSEISTGLTVTGKVESGFVMADDNLSIVPSKETCKVKAVRILGDVVDYAAAGSNVELSLKGIDISLLHVGAFLCDPENPIRTARRFAATIQTFDLGQFGVIRPGHEVVVHLNNIVEAGCLGRKLMIHDLSDGKAKGKNEPQKKRRAKILGSKQTASIRIDLKKPICLELFSNFRQLGRFTLRDQGRTIAAGIVTEIFG